MTAALRDGILAALVAHDPLREASDGDAVEPYAFEADELATILAGSAADAGTCAVAVWAVLGGAAFGHPHACAALGDEIALVLDRHPGADADPELWDEADADDADGPDEAEYAELGDALGTAVLMALITRDPYALGRVEMAVDWHAAYAPLAVDVVLRLRGESEPLATTIDLVRDGALGQPACPPADELDVRLQLLAEDLREVARAVSYLAADDIAAEVDPDADDPLVAGVRSILERHDPAGDAVQRSGYGDIAAGVAECLREATEADAELCARVVWTELRRWGDPSRVGEVAGVGGAGREIADVLDLYRDAFRLRPMLVARAVPPAPADRLVRAAQDVLAELDPLAAHGHGDDYEEQAAHVAAVLRDGVDGALHCQTVIWRVVVRWFGAFAAGPLSAYRDAGSELLRAVRENAA